MEKEKLYKVYCMKIMDYILFVIQSVFKTSEIAFKWFS